jgi:hypothetical protein
MNQRLIDHQKALAFVIRFHTDFLDNDPQVDWNGLQSHAPSATLRRSTRTRSTQSLHRTDPMHSVAALTPRATAVARTQSRTTGGAGKAIRNRASTVVVRAGDLEPDNISVLVCGGNGVAMDVFRQLTEKGTWATVLQRHETNRKEIEGVGGFLVKGDALDPKAVTKAMNQSDEYDAVVSTIGGTPADPRADSEANIALIDAAAAKGVGKFVLVTSIGVGDSADAPPPNVFDALKPVLVEKAKAEEHLKAVSAKTGMPYVIVRPGGLKSEPATGTAVLTENVGICGAIHREDVADLVIRCVLKEKANGKVLSAVDNAQLFDQPAFEPFEV